MNDGLMISLPHVGDTRRRLCFAQVPDHVPFETRRIYWLTYTNPELPRGFHAHRQTRQLAICIKGSLRMLLDDGRERRWIEMSDGCDAILIEPHVWHEMHSLSFDCVLLVLADRVYDPDDYIRDRSTFERLAGNAR